jgi:hypothetical protein
VFLTIVQTIRSISEAPVQSLDGGGMAHKILFYNKNNQDLTSMPTILFLHHIQENKLIPFLFQNPNPNPNPSNSSSSLSSAV